jgi:hypothetical protein
MKTLTLEKAANIDAAVKKLIEVSRGCSTLTVLTCHKINLVRKSFIEIEPDVQSYWDQRMKLLSKYGDSEMVTVMVDGKEEKRPSNKFFLTLPNKQLFDAEFGPIAEQPVSINDYATLDFEEIQDVKGLNPSDVELLTELFNLSDMVLISKKDLEKPKGK